MVNNWVRVNNDTSHGSVGQFHTWVTLPVWPLWGPRVIITSSSLRTGMELQGEMILALENYREDAGIYSNARY